MMDRIEEFTLEGKSFVYYDMSGFKTLEEYVQLIEAAKSQIVKYPENSLLTISNIKHIRLDTAVKQAWAEWMEFNKHYVKYGAIIGVDGLIKIMANSALNISGRNNMNFVFTKEESIDWLLKQK
jgi:hypothetical protein